MQMNLTTLIAAFSLISGAVSMPGQSRSERAGDLLPRSCNLQDPCTAAKGIKSGIYCGYCAEVGTSWNNYDVYQLNGEDGLCCNYGRSDACQKAEDNATFDQSLCPKAK